MRVSPIIVRCDHRIAAVEKADGWIGQGASHAKIRQRGTKRTHDDFLRVISSDDESRDQHILSGSHRSAGADIPRPRERLDLSAQQPICLIRQLVMTCGRRMKVIPEQVLVRIHPRRALRRISCVDEVIVCRLSENANQVQPNIEIVNVNGNSALRESISYGIDDRI